MKRIIISETVKYLEKEVKISGWAARVRDHGGLIFIDLRDWSGKIQVIVDKNTPDIFSEAEKIGLEYVVEFEGVVKKRDDSLVNTGLETGNIELVAKSIKILNKSKNLPFPLDGDGHDIDEKMRLKYRYLDIRRKRIRDLIELRHKLMLFTRNWFSDNGFVEVQTPLLTVSSPEGARDFLVPSRIHRGKFYALPQAPQQYKQLLMVGGLDRYFQIAPCFRDEDPRADRHSGDFYQLDVECSFVTQQEFFERVEPYFKDVVSKLTQKELKEFPFPQITYTEALSKYGSDKPDLRYEMFLTDLTSELKESDINIFKSLPSSQAILVNREFNKNEIEKLTVEIQREGAKGLAWFSLENEAFGGPMAKFLEDSVQLSIKNKLKGNGYSISGKQTIFVISDEQLKAQKLMGWLRSRMGDMLNLKDPNKIAFGWIVDFPMFEWDEKNNKWDFAHNPFSMPEGGLEALGNQKPNEILAQQYDLTCNGYELASGSIRNYHPDTLIEAFKIVGYSEDETRAKFAHMISAFEYGAPPHGGFAPGLDRFMMILFDEENIKEVYAFPKSNGMELMTGCPREVDKTDLDILGIELKK